MALSRDAVRYNGMSVNRGWDHRAWVKNQTARVARRASREAVRDFMAGEDNDATPRKARIHGWAD